MPTDEQIDAAREAFATHGQTGHLRAQKPSVECMRAALTAAEGAKPRVKPLDLSNLLHHAFASGYMAAAGDGGWSEYDPAKCEAYARILSALTTEGE